MVGTVVVVPVVVVVVRVVVTVEVVVTVVVCARPLDTFSRTVVPGSTCPPAVGLWVTTRPWAWDDGMSTTFAASPAFVS